MFNVTGNSLFDDRFRVCNIIFLQVVLFSLWLFFWLPFLQGRPVFQKEWLAWVFGTR